MRQLSVILVLMILIFGTMQLAFAQTNTDAAAKEPTLSNVKPIKPAASSTIATQIPKPITLTQTNIQSVTTATSVSKCLLSDELMKEYNQLLIELRKAESEGDKERAEEITKKIIFLKQAITKTIEKCGVNTYIASNQCDNAGTMFRNVYVECYDGIETMEGDATSCKSSSDWQSFAKDFCKGHCKKVETLISSACPEATATAGGGAGQGGGCFDTDGGKDYYKKGIAAGIWDSCISKYKLSERYCTDNNKGADYIKECPLGYLCEDGACVESEEDDREEITTPTKPVVADSGEEIKDYYKTRIEKITSLDNVDEQIKGLKALREEVDNLIEELIRSKNAITVSDISDLVTKISVNAGEINADNVQIKTIGKKILANVNNKPISIEPTEKQVLIKDENLEVRTMAVSLQDNALRVGNAEVKLTASDVVDKLKITPKEIELKEENTKAVYKIKADENRKLLGFIPVKIEMDLTADANNGNVLEEHKTWYSFLTTE